MSVSYKLGCNFDFALINGIKKLNESYDDKITEVFGSDRLHAYLTARPDFRLPDITQKNFEQYVKELSKINVDFNYTMNSIFPGDKRFLDANYQIICDFVKYLEDIGVRYVTIGNPILLDFVRSTSKTIGIEISTIMHIDTITQIKYLNDEYNIQKVCNNLLKNRSIGFLKNAAYYCNQNNIKLDLMVNEFCGVGHQEYSTACPYRDSCYIYHSTNKTKDDAELLKTYPMGYCITSRDTHPCNWLRMRFIRPEDICRYEEIGINHFKITGRTGTTEYILKMAETYLKRSFDGNLLELWKPLETIYSGESEITFKHTVNIPNKRLNIYMDKWFNNPEFDCANKNCGSDGYNGCRYCHKYYDEFIAGE